MTKTSRKNLINIPRNVIPAPHLGVMGVRYMAKDRTSEIGHPPIGTVAMIDMGTIAIHTTHGGRLWTPSMTDLNDDAMMLRAILHDGLGVASDCLRANFIERTPGCLRHWKRADNEPMHFYVQQCGRMLPAVLVDCDRLSRGLVGD